MATSPLSSVGSVLVSVGQLLQSAAGGGQAAPQQQAAAAPQAPVDQFAPAAPNAAGAAPAGGGDLTSMVGQLVGMLQQVMQLLQQFLGGGQGQGQAGAGAGAGAGAAAAGSGSVADSAASAFAQALAGAGGSPAAASSGAASSGAASAPAPDSQPPPPQSTGGDGGGDGGGGDPLVFDLGGKGVGFDTAHQTTANLNGKGGERINDLSAGTGLLTFAGDPNKGVLANSFGDKTDLSKFGLKGDRPDGTFSNGFTALRALGEHFGLIGPGDQSLSASDLKVLEDKAGVKMRVGGVNGQDRSLADLGVSQINLGNPNAVESKAQATRDANGNLLQHQAGASFVMNGQTRGYADAWFKDQPAVGRAA